ncbi:hypothetical protein Tco_1537369 [Tanacetum coccineum]
MILGCSVCCCPIAKILHSGVNCTSAIGSSSYMALIYASSASVSFHDLLLSSCTVESVLMLSVSTKLASNALPANNTPTPPQVFEIGKCSDKMYLKHHEKQVEDILNYLDELSLHRIEKMEEGRINGNKLKTELKKIRTQIIKLQKKQLGQKDKIAFAYYRISNLELNH